MRTTPSGTVGGRDNESVTAPENGRGERPPWPGEEDVPAQTKPGEEVEKGGRGQPGYGRGVEGGGGWGRSAHVSSAPRKLATRRFAPPLPRKTVSLATLEGATGKNATP